MTPHTSHSFDEPTTQYFANAQADRRPKPQSKEDLLVEAIRDPNKFTAGVLGVELWGVQQQILAALNVPNARVAVKACHASGKTFTAGNGVAWFMVRYKDAIVPTTAPTWAQVKNLLWKEIDTAVKRANLDNLPPVRTTDWRFTKSHYATGISTKETERFQGFHSGHILIVVDEGPGVAEEIWLAIEGIESGGDVRILTLGNPSITSGRFYDAFNRNRRMWTTFTIDAFDTPNFTSLPGATWQEKLDYLAWAEVHDSNILDSNPNPFLTTRKWVLDRSRAWGVDSPLWTARVRGNFPSQSSSSLIALDWVEQAKYVEGNNGIHVVGCDVARFGVDYTTYCEMFGNEINRMWKYQKRDTVSTFEELRSIYRRDPSCVFVVDDSGVGGGVVDMLRNANIPVIAFNAGESPTYNEEVLNRGSEAYWNLSLVLRDADIAIGPEVPGYIVEELTAQLVQVEYKFTQKGLIQVMKKGIKDDLPSPDLGDALNMANVGRRLQSADPTLASATITPGELPSGSGGGYSGDSYSWRDRVQMFNGWGPGLARSLMPGNSPRSSIAPTVGDPDAMQQSQVNGSLLMICPSCGSMASLMEIGKTDGKRHYKMNCRKCGLDKIHSTPA